MRKIAFALTIIVLFVACDQAKNGYTLTGSIEGELDNGTNVYLRTTDTLNQIIDVDTAQITEGSFEFIGNQEIPQLHYLFVEGVMGNVPVILENGAIKVEFQKDSLAFAEIEGTYQNERFMEFLDESRDISQSGQSINDDFQKANAQRDTAMMESLREEFFELQDRVKTYHLDFVKANPDALISALILDNLLRSKVIEASEAQAMYDAFTPEIKNSKPGKRIKTQLEQQKGTKVGAVAPEFSAPTPDGDLLALAEVKGKVTLIDFWAAWCRPCRYENPNIVAVYNKYKDKGLNIVGVSLDNNKDQWKQAIEQDGLDWHHVSHLKRFQDPVAKLYNVDAIPAAFLLDENGVIVAKNLRGPALEQKVAELLN